MFYRFFGVGQNEYFLTRMSDMKGKQMVGEVRSARGVDTIPLETIYLESRDLFIKGEITCEAADAFCEQFVYLLRKGKEPIRVWISSLGGSIPDGLRIYDIMTTVKDVPVYTIAYGSAYSMAGVIFIAGTKGCRLMLPHTRLMLHPASFSGSCGGSLRDMKAKSDMLQEYEDITNHIVSIHSGQSVEQIVKENTYDHYYTVDKAIEYGFCDRIVRYADLLEG